MASESFTSEQIRAFRQIFSERSNPAEGGLRLESFAQTIEVCLQTAGLPQPPPTYLDSEFRRLSTTGTVSWQQFFQVLIHINVSHVQGIGYEQEPSSPPPPIVVHPSPSPHPPHTGITNASSRGHTPDPSNHQQSTVAPNNGGDIVQSSRSRVGFADSPEIVNVVEVVEYTDDVPIEPSTSWGQTIRRGGVRLGRAVGNFFGVTNESAYGSSNQVGWARVGEQSAEETFTTTRRLSFRSILQDEPPPEYPGPPSLPPGAAGARSFNPDELSDSSEDDLFITPAPPDYQEVIGDQPPVPEEDTVFVEVHGNDAFTPITPPSTTALLTPQSQNYPPPTRSVQRQQPQQQPRQQPITTRDADLIYDLNDALNHYKKFVQAERSLRQRRHHQGAFEFFGSVDATEPTPSEAQVSRRGSIRRARLGSASESQPVELRRRKKKKNTKLQRQSTLVRHKVESLPSFKPWFIIVMSVLQVVALVVIIAVRGIATIHAIPVKHTEMFPSLSATNNDTTASVTYYRAVNLWIGLTPRDLIQIGAKFTPCMRRDFGIQRRNTRLYGDRRDSLACCKNRDNVGTVLAQTECAACQNSSCIIASTNPTADIAIALNGTCAANFNTSTIGLASFHPCCISITGLCRVTSLQECDARGGQFHVTKDSCLEVNCLESVCGFNNASVGVDNDTPYLPTANQFWRWFLSIFIHLGVIHIIIVIPIQLYVGWKIERTIGWLRVGLIYLISGVGGNIVSAVFVPYGVNAGASGAVVGLIGVLFVELFQYWQIVDNAWIEFLKLLGFTVFLLAVGTLPYIDNMAHIGGLLFGVVAAVVFVPYITFGKFDTFRKRVVLAICLPLLIALFVTGLLTFYFIPDSSFCEDCGYINCFPYVADLCPDEYRNPDPYIFSL